MSWQGEVFRAAAKEGRGEKGGMARIRGELIRFGEWREIAAAAAV